MKDQEVKTTPPSTRRLRILMIEDDAADVELALRELKRAGFEVQAEVIQTPDEFDRCLEKADYDAIFSDYKLPGWTGIDAAIRLRERKFYIPFILVSGILGEEAAVDCIKQGISDYVLKDRISRLPLALERALQEQELRKARAQAEHEVRQRERRFRALIENSSDGIALVDPDGVVLPSTPATAAVLGCSSADSQDRNVFDLVHPEDRPKAREVFADILAQPSWAVPFQLRCRHRDGSWRWTEGVGQNLLAEPSVQAVVIHYRDISKRIQAQEALSASETRFRRLFEAAQDGILLLDSETGATTDINPYLLELLGYTREEVLGRKLWEIGAFPDVVKSQDTFRTLQEEGFVRYEDLPLEAKSGGRRDVEFVSNVYQSGGQKVIQCNIRDITARRRAEEEVKKLNESLEIRVAERTADLEGANCKLASEIADRKLAEGALANLQQNTELILNSAGDGILRVDVDGKCTFANPAAVRMLGYAPEEFLGQDLWVLGLHAAPGDPPCTPEKCSLAAALKQGVVRRAENQMMRRKDGSATPVDTSTTPIVERGEVVGAVLTLRDVSERRAMEKMKDEFVSVVSHELRTPLTAIRGSLALLAAGEIAKQPGPARRMVEIAVNNSERLVRLVNGILDSARLESESVVLTRQTCSAPELALQATELMRPLAGSAGVQLEVDAQPVSFSANPDGILQVLTNLLSNAIKFSPPASTVRLECRPEDGNVSFRVIDHGPGIPADKVESIFGRFQPVDASESRRRGGTGLGLSICRSIARHHGGQIWAESELGNGSTFVMTLPAELPATYKAAMDDLGRS